MGLLLAVVGGVLLYLMHQRISNLEKTIATMKQLQREDSLSPSLVEQTGTEGHQRYQSVAPQRIEPLVPPPVSPVITPAPSLAPAATTNSMLEWIQKDFLVKLGAFLLLLALGWFVSYAFANNWIGPVGRITLGLFFGASVLCFGFWRLRTQLHQGEIFMVLGASIITITILAARILYNFFTPASALAVIFTTVVLMAFVAVQFRTAGLALAAMLLASAAPFFIHSADPSVLLLLTYIAVVMTGTTWVVYRLEAVPLLLIALAITAFYSLPIVALSGEEAIYGLIFGLFFTLLFFFTTIIAFLRHPNASDARTAFLAFGVGLYVFSVVGLTPLLDDSLRGMTYIAWALVFAFGSFFTERLCQSRTPFYVYGSVAIGLLGIASVTLLSDDVLTIVLALEIMLLTLVVLRVFHNEREATLISLLLVIPGFLGLQNILSFPTESGNPLNSDALVMIALILILSVVGSALRQTVGYLSAIGAGFYAAAFIWLFLHTMLLPQIATMVALFIYTVIGLGTYLYGRTTDSNGYKLAGGVILGLVIVRLLTVEVWEMEIAGRIILFTVIGILFISTAFISRTREQKHDQ